MLFTWGRGDLGQLGSGSETYQLEPYKVLLPGHPTVEALSCGPYQTAITTSTFSFMCGHGASGQLGNSSKENKFEFTRVSRPGDHRPVKTQKVHREKMPHLLRKLENGTLYLWCFEIEDWVECLACTLFKKHACFCKIKPRDSQNNRK